MLLVPTDAGKSGANASRRFSKYTGSDCAPNASEKHWNTCRSSRISTHRRC